MSEYQKDSINKPGSSTTKNILKSLCFALAMNFSPVSAQTLHFSEGEVAEIVSSFTHTIDDSTVLHNVENSREAVFSGLNNSQNYSRYPGSILDKQYKVVVKTLAETALSDVKTFMDAHDIRNVQDILNFSNSIAYEDESKKMEKYGSNGVGLCKAPLQTCYEMEGDCDDVSLVCYSMLSVLGIKSAMLVYDDHMNIAVPFPYFSTGKVDEMITAVMHDGEQYVVFDPVMKGSPVLSEIQFGRVIEDIIPNTYLIAESQNK